MFEIRERVNQISTDLIERGKHIEPPTLGHFLHAGVMDNGLKPLQIGTKIAGTALTVMAHGRDSTICHKAIDFIKPGDVIVIDRGEDRRYACWGEMTALAAELRGAEAAIIDGPITDVQVLREMKLSIYCTGTSAMTTQLLGSYGAINVPIQCGGVVVHPGDLILGDDNGLVVLDAANAERWIEIAEAEEEAEASYREALLAGKLPTELFAIDQLIENSEYGSEIQ